MPPFCIGLRRHDISRHATLFVSVCVDMVMYKRNISVGVVTTQASPLKTRREWPTSTIRLLTFPALAQHYGVR